MTVSEMIDRLDKMDKDKVIIIMDSVGWSNIDGIIENGSTVLLMVEESPVFDN